MALILDGDGTISGLNAGGLPDSSITTADIANAAITAAKLDGAQSGSAPIYAARAWVNFNGTGTVAIRASGNVSSITDNGTGNYTANFTTAMADANYSAVFISNSSIDIVFLTTSTASGVSVSTAETTLVAQDANRCNIAVFR